MAIGLSVQDIELLGYRDVKQRETSADSPVLHFTAHAAAGLEDIEADFVYFKSNCTAQDLQRFRPVLSTSKKTFFVKPKSLKLSEAAFKISLGAATVFIYEELIWGKVAGLFRDYTEGLRDTIVTEPCFVTPRSLDGSAHDDLFDQTLDYLKGRRNADTGKLLVLAASAGVGKTTLSRRLVAQLLDDMKADSKLIPVYVEASHWVRLELDSVDDLWGIIENSLRAFSANIRLSESLFRHILAQGHVCFIFDGLDELCGRRTSIFDPNEVLQNLAAVVSESVARVILTTRTLYWEAQVQDAPSNVRLIKVAPFNPQQAKGYLDKFFKNDRAMYERAVGLYSRLTQQAGKPRSEGGARAQFINLPLCVGMVAEIVKAGGEIAELGHGELFEKLLLQICEREVVRQKLVTPAREQWKALKDLAVAYDDVIDLEMLEACGVDRSDVPKFISHPLLTRSPAGNSYRFKYDFMGPYLRAHYIAEAIRAGTLAAGEAAWEWLKQDANGKGFLTEHLSSILGMEDLEGVGRFFAVVPGRHREARSFLLHVVKSLVQQDVATKSGVERTTTIFGQLYGARFTENRLIPDLYAAGSWERLDLRGVKFERCTFQDMAFRDCKADRTTVFSSCTFLGSCEVSPAERPGEGWGSVDMQSTCIFQFPANVIWDELLSRQVGERDENLKDVIQVALGKFWHHGRPKLSLRKNDWNTGVLGYSGYAKSILTAFIKVGLVYEVTISGVQEGGLALDRDSIADVQRFMDSRQVSGKVREAFQELSRG